MKFLKWILCSWVCIFSFAASACVLLGSHPSFIVRANSVNLTSIPHHPLSSTQLKHLSSVTGLTFTSSVPMALGRYVLHFQSPQIDQVCFKQVTIQKWMQALKKVDGFNDVTPNRLYRVVGYYRAKTVAHKAPTPGNEQWGLGATTGGGINAASAWQINAGGSPKVISAIVDSGVLPNESLAPNVLNSDAATFNEGGNVIKPGAEPSCLSCAATDHGTHVAGIVASTGNGSYGRTVYGVAYQTQILPVNVFTKFDDAQVCGSEANTPCLLSYLSDQINALSWLGHQATFSQLPAAPDVAAVNLSLGGDGSCTNVERDIYTVLKSQGITAVVAAGNNEIDAADFSPANCGNNVIVSASNELRQKAYYSNFGEIVDIAAPGGDFGVDSGIISTVENGYRNFQGTSMAAPIVTGVVALLYSVDPTMNRDKVLQAIVQGVTPIVDAPAPRNCNANQPCGAGIINAGDAVTWAYARQAQIAWTPQFVTEQLSEDSVKLSWQSAAWSNGADTAFRYSVSLDGKPFASCQLISATTCTVTFASRLQKLYRAEQSINFTVSATDGRAIKAPDTESGVIHFVLAPMVLSYAERNVSDHSVVYVYYSNPGSISLFDSFHTAQFPQATVQYDAGNQRFVITGINNAVQTNVTITASSADGEQVVSNAAIIPGTQALAPQLLEAVRNPLSPTQAWVFYQSAGSYDYANQYHAAALSDARIQWDELNQRFDIESINTPARVPFSITVTNYLGNSAQSNTITLPGILE